ncbi:MAG: hypothetical protein C0427_01430 [Rhodobacter sp.]|nr:hypothetical protein [Rhodobacter sp.]
MAVAHLYGLTPIQSETPRAPRMSVEPIDFSTVADLALSISGCARVCIRLANPDTGEVRMAFFPEHRRLKGEVKDLPEALLAQGQAVVPIAGTPLAQQVAEAGMPGLTLYAGFTLRSQEGRSLGVLAVMDTQRSDLPEAVLVQLGQLAEILSRGIGMAASTIRTMARQSLGLMQDLLELDQGAVGPEVTGLLRYAAGREPSEAESLAMRKAGLAVEAEGVLLLTPMARDMLYIHGFRVPKRKPAGPSDEPAA